MSSKEKVASIIVGLEIVGCCILAVYCYGRAKYYQGRIDKYDELKPIMEAQQILIHDLVEEQKKEES